MAPEKPLAGAAAFENEEHVQGQVDGAVEAGPAMLEGGGEGLPPVLPRLDSAQHPVKSWIEERRDRDKQTQTQEGIGDIGRLPTS